MVSTDRRLGFRVPLSVLMTSFVGDRPVRALTANISDTGVRLQTVKMPRGPAVVGLELELPGTGEVIWARGEICYRRGDELEVGVGHGLGVRFTAMPLCHARLVRDFCVEQRRAQLATLLERIRRPAPRA
jgi:PilZ domain-containing protein